MQRFLMAILRKSSTLSYLSFGPLDMNQNRFSQSWISLLSKPPWLAMNLASMSWSLFIGSRGLLESGKPLSLSESYASLFNPSLSINILCDFSMSCTMHEPFAIWLPYAFSDDDSLSFDTPVAMANEELSLVPVAMQILFLDIPLSSLPSFVTISFLMTLKNFSSMYTLPPSITESCIPSSTKNTF